MRTLLLVLAGALLLPGCIQMPGGDEDLADRAREGRTGGTMTGEETRTEEAGLCTEGVSLLGGNGKFCATRTIRVDGTLSGFSALDVDAQTFNGGVRVTSGSEGRWGFTATLKARGDTADEARRRLDDIDLRWAHEDASGHFVEVVAAHEGDSDGRLATIELQLPRSLALSLVAASSNGDVAFQGGRADKLALSTSNGNVVARGEAAHAALTTSNGDVDATLTPTADGRWSLTTSNGDVTLKVPEGDTYGYKMEGVTSNGEVDYALRDGEEGPCPEGSQYYTPPCNHRAFETRGFAGRDLQTYVALTTSIGQVKVAPK